MAVPKKVAIVLAGAVAKGAFEAGALQALAAANVEIVRIVASSSGALNGTLLAHAVRNRDLVRGTQTLVDVWRDRAGWLDVFELSLRDVIKLDGVSNQAKILGLLRQYVSPVTITNPAPIQLRMIVAPLAGTAGSIGDRAATTYEAIRDFDGTAFDSTANLERLFNAATASSAFPVLFAPVAVDGLGPCIDGGVVNNTPIKWAVDGEVGATVDAVVVVSSSVELRTQPTADVHGIALVGHLAEMLIEERLYRDLRESEATNEMIDRLAALVTAGTLTADQLAAVWDALALETKRHVDVIEIRPVSPLSGSAFTGFFNAKVRADHLAAGLARGTDVLRSFA